MERIPDSRVADRTPANSVRAIRIPDSRAVGRTLANSNREINSDREIKSKISGPVRKVRIPTNGNVLYPWPVIAPGSTPGAFC